MKLWELQEQAKKMHEKAQRLYAHFPSQPQPSRVKWAGEVLLPTSARGETEADRATRK